MLAAGVAHEINNPLAAVIANLDLAISDLEGVAISQDVREELADARAAAAAPRRSPADFPDTRTASPRPSSHPKRRSPQPADTQRQ